MRWLGLVLVGTAAITAGSAAPISAAPRIEIKGRTRIALDRVHLVDADQVEVTGHLLDSLTGDAIPHQHLEVTLGGRHGAATTDADGRFELMLPAVAGPQRVEVTFDGGAFVDPAALADTVDPARAQVTLVLRADPSPTGVKLTVDATVDDKPAVLPVQLSITAPLASGAWPTATALLPPLAAITTDHAFELTRATAGGTGARRIRATFAGDAARQGATTEVAIEVSAATLTAMALSTSELAFEDKLVVTGTVVDEDGKGVPRAAVTLASGDRRLAQGATTADGHFQLSVEAEVVGQGNKAVQVSADPATPYLRPSRANPAQVHVSAPEPVPVSYTIAAFVATALAAGGFFLARSKPWRKLRRRPAPADAAAETPERGDGLPGGLVTSRPGLVNTLRRASDDGFAGLVRDTVRGRAVEGAVVRLVLGNDVREVATGPDGTFSLEQLTGGDWRASATASGLITETFAVSIPHRGELRGVRVDLVPVRERVFQLYRRAAEPVLPEPRLWGVWSPRQIVDHVRTRRESPALAELTDFVEELYFSARIAPESVLPAAAERVELAVAERRQSVPRATSAGPV